MHKIVKMDGNILSIHFVVVAKANGDKVNIQVVFLDSNLIPISEVITVICDLSEFLNYESAKTATMTAISEAISINNRNNRAKKEREVAEEIINNMEL